METRKIKILAIDDNPDNLISIKALIGEAFPNAMVFTALTGKKGIELAMAENPDAILLDIVMPGMDGFEVCKELKSSAQMRDIPVVFVTAIKGDKESRIKALECGAEAFLAKPIDESELTAQIRAMVKIKTANIEKRNEKSRLEALVAERTRELNQTHTATLNLLEEVKKENLARRESEEKIEKNKERFKNISDSISDMSYSCITNPDGVLVLDWIYGACEKITGCTAEELLAMKCWGELVFEEDLPLFKEHVLDVKPGTSDMCQIRLKNKNGKIVWIQASAKCIAQEKTGSSYLFGGILDISVRKQIEEQLQASEARFRNLLQNVEMISVQGYGPDGTTQYWNKASEKIYGFSSQEAIGQKLTDLIIPDEMRSDVEQAIQYMATTGQPVPASELSLVRKDGSRVSVYSTHTIIQVPGKDQELFCIDFDLTEREHAAQKLQHVARLYALLGQINQSIVRIRERDQLFRSICEVAVEFGHFRMAWIGLSDKRLNRIIPSVWAGEEDGYLNQVKIAIDHESIAKGPSGLAVNLGKMVICNDISADTNMRPWKDEALKRGYRSSVAVPFNCKGEIVGTLNLYADESYFFNEDEEMLLLEIGEDISFALDAMASENERKLTDQALRESEKFLTETQIIANLGTYSFDIVNNHWICSDLQNEIFGIDEDFDRSLDGWTSIIHPDWQQMMKDYFIREVIGRKVRFDKEYKIIRIKDRAERWVHGLGNLKFNDLNQPVMMVGTIQDITDRKNSELALKESEERYRSFITAVSEGVYRLEADVPMDVNLPLEEQVDFIYDHLFVRECNEAFLKMYGMKDRKSVLGKRHLEFHGGRNNHLNRNLLRDFVRNGYHIENGITEESDLSGRKIYFTNNSIGIIENDHLVRMWGTQMDITEKVKEEHVQQVLYAISNAAFSSKDLHELVKIISEQLGKLLDSSNFYIALYDESTGMLSTHYEKDEKDQFSSWKADRSATGYVIKHRKSLLINEKETIELCEAGEIEMVGSLSKVWLGVPLMANDKAIGAIVVQNYDNPDTYTVKDKLMLEFISLQISISIERKMADQALEEALAKAQESDRLKSAFLANMSHEIRTPMNGILGFAGLLKEPKLSGEEQEEYINIIEKSGARMLNIINDIISISKVESGQMHLAYSLTNINDQISYIYTFFKPEAEQKGLQLRFKKSLTSQEATINTDREKVYAILTNLVKNAIKYCDTGTIEFGYHLKPSPVETRHAGETRHTLETRQTLETRHALSLPNDPDNTSYELEFYVKDTGIGIPNDRQQAIFDRFVQADIGDKRAFQGAGLGLSISKAYVEMMGGKIGVESEEGKGSCFYFTLPYTCTSGGKESDIQDIYRKPGNVISGLKILIAEDDDTSAKLISVGVKDIGKDILKVKTGIHAVDVCRNNPDIDLVLMDIKMPEMNGYEATKQIRQFNNDVVIIAQTAYALIGDRERAIEAGCNDYIPKPFGRLELTELVSKYF